MEREGTTIDSIMESSRSFKASSQEQKQTFVLCMLRFLFQPSLSLLLGTGLLLLMVEELSAGNHRNHEGARCPAPQYPANVKVLMDSWHQPLLPAEDEGSASAGWTTNKGTNHVSPLHSQANGTECMNQLQMSMQAIGCFLGSA